MDKQEIKRSARAIQVKVRNFIIVFVLIALVAIPILLIPFSFLSSNYLLWLVFSWAIAILLCLAGANALKVLWNKTRYYITDEAILIKSGSMVGNKERLIPFDGMARASITQNFLEKRGGYGKISLVMKNGSERFVLSDVIEPQKLADSVLKNISESFTTKIIK